MNGKRKSIKKLEFRPFAFILFVILAIYTVLLVTLFVWGFITSFKDNLSDFRVNKFGLPKVWHFEHYLQAFQGISIKLTTETGTRNVYMTEMFLNSLLYSLGGSIMQTLTTLVMAYLVAKYDNPVSRIIFGIVVVTMILPIVGSLPSEIEVSRKLGLFDSIVGIWIMRSTFLGIYFLVFHSMFKGVSRDFDEAAKIDGASQLRIMLEVNFPLLKNSIVTVFLLSFIGYWNDYTIPMIYLPNHPTLASGLYWFSQSTVGTYSNVPMKLAGCMIVVIPILILFLLLSNKVMGNVSAGGVKE